MQGFHFIMHFFFDVYLMIKFINFKFVCFLLFNAYLAYPSIIKYLQLVELLI